MWIVEIIEYGAVQLDTPEFGEAGVGEEDKGEEGGDDAHIDFIAEAGLGDLHPEGGEEGEPEGGCDVAGCGEVERESVDDSGEIVGECGIVEGKAVIEHKDHFGHNEDADEGGIDLE